MFAITCNLGPSTPNLPHANGPDGAMSEICHTLRQFGFERQPNNLYLSDSEDLANLFKAMTALKKLPWLASSLSDIRAFRVEQYSDFTTFIKS